MRLAVREGLHGTNCLAHYCLLLLGMEKEGKKFTAEQAKRLDDAGLSRVTNLKAVKA